MDDNDASQTPGGAGEESAAASDGSLLRRFRRGDRDAATRLYIKYANRLTALVRRRSSLSLQRKIDPEEIVQSIFRTLFRRVETGRIGIPTGDELWYLLLAISLNKIRRKVEYLTADCRDYRRECVFDEDLLVKEMSSDPVHELEVLVEETLNSLPEVHRRTAVLRLEGYQLAEIAQITGRSKRTIERLMRQCRELLSEHLAVAPSP